MGVDSAEIGTPDHYRYPWDEPNAVQLRGDFVHVEWLDGVALDAYSLWLYENDPASALEPVSRECTIVPSSLPAPNCIVRASITDTGSVRVEWSSGGSAEFHPGWLRHVAGGAHGPGAFLEPREAWTAASLPEPPTSSLCAPIDSVAGTAAAVEWLENLGRYGLGRLRGIGSDADALVALMKEVGPIRGSNFGDVFTVEAIIEPDSTANTGLELTAHTDLPTRETPPGFQFLHCIENGVAGGLSYMTDGLAIIDHLRVAHGDAYLALSELDWIWFNRQANNDHRWTGPVIDHGGRGSPTTIRAFYPVRSFPAMATTDVPRAYEALRLFHRLADDPAFRIEFRFEPGDVIGFDNRQVLHGRSGFDSGGRRVLRGCYVDRDDVLSTMRVNARRAQPGTKT